MTDQPADPSATPIAGREQMTEEQIQAYSVGVIEPLKAPIQLAEPDAGWPALFDREETRIRAVLGDRVIDLQHTGSTSVPGLAAKPIIDITMIVADVTDEPAFVPDLEAAGYVLRIRENEPDWYDHRVFKGPDTNVNLHVFSRGCVELERMVGFRTGSGLTTTTASSTRRRSATSSGTTGSSSRTTPTPRPRSSRRSWPEPDCPAAGPDGARAWPRESQRKGPALTPRPESRTVPSTQMNDLFYFRRPA
jgi:GrpB-like predicted nucleotidyltransferase (UPF0157 family)